jgi:hypothetical protein
VSWRRCKPCPPIRARLDNIALVPASLLFHKAKYKAIANQLPRGSVLICAPTLLKQCRTLEHVASYFSLGGSTGDDPSCYTAYRIKDTEGISYEASFLPNLAPPYGRPDPLAIKRRIANNTIAPMTAMSSVAQK